MSFVLDAQRKQHSADDPDRAARAAYAQAQATRRRDRRILGGLIAAAALAAVLVVWFLVEPPSPNATAPSAARVTSATPQIAPPEIAPSVALQAPKPQPAPAAPPARKPPPPPPTSLDRASVAAQEALLGFRYSSHIWGNDPDTRTIGVDGRRLRTGETHKGWLLEEINEDGVVWRRDRERVQVPVLRMWEGR